MGAGAQFHSDEFVQFFVFCFLGRGFWFFGIFDQFVVKWKRIPAMVSTASAGIAPSPVLKSRAR